MNGYKAFFRGKQADVYAETLYAAKVKAIAVFGVKKNKEHEVTVMLCEKDTDGSVPGVQVVHAPSF